MKPSRSAIEARAEQLWNALLTSKPAWKQLGDTTRSVWFERAERELKATPPPFKSRFK